VGGWNSQLLETFSGMGFGWARGKWTERPAGGIHGSPSVTSVQPPLQQPRWEGRHSTWVGWTTTSVNRPLSRRAPGGSDCRRKQRLLPQHLVAVRGCQRWLRILVTAAFPRHRSSGAAVRASGYAVWDVDHMPRPQFAQLTRMALTRLNCSCAPARAARGGTPRAHCAVTRTGHVPSEAYGPTGSSRTPSARKSQRAG
jgi:hypothetical protein